MLNKLHGTCHLPGYKLPAEGTSNCSAPFGGADCFVDTALPPNLFFLANNGLCDTSRDLCNTITVYNNNTLADPTLSCYFEPVMVRGLYDCWTCINLSVNVLNGGDGGLFLACEDLGRMFDYSFPACAFFFF